jgi:phosphoglycerate dehydrogenase-like enzyme
VTGRPDRRVKLVVHPRVGDEWLRRIHGASPALDVVVCESEAEAEREVAAADAFYGTVTPRVLRAARRLRWVQAPIAGLERYMFPELAEHPAVLTNMRGVYDDMVPEHAFLLMLALARGMRRYARLQESRRWERHEVAVLGGQTVGVVGLGGIGSGLARRAAAFDMRVIGLDPRVDRLPATAGGGAALRPAELDALLEQSDWVVICAPHTPDTEKMFRRVQLRRMKRTACLINVGRGVIVDLADLTEALRASEIAGAGLDVFEVEPLPADHPLWAMPNVVITPHVAAEAPGVAARWLEVLLDNLGRFIRDEPLRNVVDKTRWC